MKALKWLDDHFEELVLGLLLVFISIVMMWQIIMRYVFSSSLSWAEEACRYAWILSTFLSIGFCMKKGSELKVDILAQSLPVKTRRTLELLIQIFVTVLMCYMFIASFEAIGNAYFAKQVSSAMRMPFYWLYIGASIGYGIGLLRSIQLVVKMIKNFNNVEKVKGGQQIDC